MIAIQSHEALARGRHRLRWVLVAAALFVPGIVLVVPVAPAAAEVPFSHVVIDGDGPANPHVKALGDVDGDGLLDVVVGSSV